MITFDEMVREAISFLEQERVCSKHHLVHNGKRAYALDLYTWVGDVEAGKRLVGELLDAIVQDGDARVFYPGRLDPMNMSNNVIDSGAAVDCIARFVRAHPPAFTKEELGHINRKLDIVVSTYLREASVEKPITNQRLWGLTGLASWYALGGKPSVEATVRSSVELAFANMTEDGFFIYYPHAASHGAPGAYAGFTTFYQSRHTGFIRYAIEQSGMDSKLYEERLCQSERALLAMYRRDGTKDLRLECKRWYWLSEYEVASHSFDAYTLSLSSLPEARAALRNCLYQIRRHFFDGHLHAHIGAPINFQCPVFWTAHLAWLTRIQGIQELFDSADTPVSFTFQFAGKEVFVHTTASDRVLINTHWTERTLTTGVYDTGLPQEGSWMLRVPRIPARTAFSIRETLNHTWYALRGWYVREAFLRLLLLAQESMRLLLPYYSTRYGKIEAFSIRNNVAEVCVRPASKYGTIYGSERTLSIPL